jgi:hypothetical protein
MTACSSADLATEIVDLTSMPLFEIRSVDGSLLDQAVRQLTAKVRRGECVESIQGQRD